MTPIITALVALVSERHAVIAKPVVSFLIGTVDHRYLPPDIHETIPLKSRQFRLKCPFFAGRYVLDPQLVESLLRTRHEQKVSPAR